MADPLRRTLLAKLRGKKSKKGTTAGGCGVAANGGREGNEKLLQKTDGLIDRTETISGLDCFLDRAVDKEGHLNANLSDSVIDLEENSVVGTNAFPQCEATQHVNTPRDTYFSGAPRLGGRNNEKLLGVSVQREILDRGYDRVEMSRFQKHEPHFTEQVQNGARTQKKHYVPIPRQHTGGDSIGFGGCENTRFNFSVISSDRSVVTLANGHELSKNGGFNVRCETDLKILCDGVAFSDETNFRPVCVTDSVCTDRATSHMIREANCRETGPHESNILQCAQNPAVEKSVLQCIKSFEELNEFTTDLRLSNLHSPTFFPTKLDIFDINEASDIVCTRDPLRHHSLDSEDDDYYDNEILPFYEPGPQSLGISDNARVTDQIDTLIQFDDLNACPIVTNNNAQETNRLRSQLKEAYYLLMNAMQDISLRGQAEGSGFTELGSSSSQSHDSVCSDSTKNTSDAISSKKHCAQQVSDTDSLLNCHETISTTARKSPLSKSCQNVRSPKTEVVLQRSASDGSMKYTPCRSPCIQRVQPHFSSDAVGENEKSQVDKVAMAYDSNSGDDERLKDISEPENSLSGSNDSVDASEKSKNDAQNTISGGGSTKHQGVTVNKMQEWMHKGRLLSSEMKQRIAGSSLRAHGANLQQAQEASGWTKAAPLSVRVQRAKSAVSCKGTHQSAHIENASRTQINTITVSKKRNWLQQSTGGFHTSDEIGLGTEENLCQQLQQYPVPSPSPTLSASPGDQSRPGPFLYPRPSLRLPLPTVTVTLAHSKDLSRTQLSPQSRGADPFEENDADDEGEIWYNPIPEDDELEPPRPLPLMPRCSPLPSPLNAVAITATTTVGVTGLPGLVTMSGPRASQVPTSSRRPSGEACRENSAGSSMQMPPPPSLLSAEAGQVLHGNVVHSSEPPQLHRQIVACKPQEENAMSRPAVPDAELPSAGFSPPSSPNPSKKGGSLTWSFPDKIKSPRTVRKLSMKMKKLPELSRKLSVKGNPSSSSSNNSSGNQLESRTQLPRTNGSPDPAGIGQSGAGGVFSSSGNVISRYHLDSSVSPQHSSKKKSSGSSKSASKGGYLSDGDSPELVAKSGKHGSSSADGKYGKAKERDTSGNSSGSAGLGGGVGGVGSGSGSPKLHGSELDIDAFRPYSFAEQPKCTTYLSGLMSLHFYGAEDLKPPRVDSRDVYCAIQVDSVNKARTALLTCRTPFLGMDHTFNIELENAQHLKLVVFSWEATPRRNRVCCHGTVALPALFRVTRTHQLAVRLEPRGMIYVKLGLMEQWQNSFDANGAGVGASGVGADGERDPQVFGVEAWKVVQKEAAGLMVPLLIEKCIAEIERRGCQVVGLYRLCGSAAVKKELREAFERDSHTVELSESSYPDINVITGVLKDYLRELPYPLISKQLYETVLDSMSKRPLRIGAGGCENDQADSEHTVGLLDILPEVEKVTLRKLLDHLKRVASYHEVNKMTCQNLAVCFGPVLLSQRQDASSHSNRVFIDSEELASALHFKKHIEVLHYLLQLWPVIDPHGKTIATATDTSPTAEAPVTVAAAPLRRRKERPQVLNLSEAEMAGMLRPKAGRLDSPSNRYAGDWSCCQDTYFQPPFTTKEEADYDDVPSEEAEGEGEGVLSQDLGEGVEQESSPTEAQEERPLEGTFPDTERSLEAGVVDAETLDKVQTDPGEEADDKEEEEKEEDMVELDRDCGSPTEEELLGSEHITSLHEEHQQQEEEEHEEEDLLAKQHTYQAYMKIQDISPVLSHRVNLKDLQESIDILIGNLERELNKNKLNVGY